MLSSAGQRLTHTFRKLPKASPIQTGKNGSQNAHHSEVEYTAVRTVPH